MRMDKSLCAWEIQRDHEPLLLVPGAHSLDEVSRLLPQGLYTTFRTFANCTRALDLQQHLNRLYRPATDMGIQPAVTPREVRRALAELLGGYKPGEARVRLSLSTESPPGVVFAAIEPLTGPSDEAYQRGVRVVTSQVERADPQLKSTAFIQKSEQERKSLAGSGAFEALMVRNGHILEGLTSNFYYIKEGRLGTAQRGVLPGVTRRLVLKLAREHGLPVLYRALALKQLAGIDEAFLTSSSRGILPVVSIDDVQVGQGLPGPHTRQLMERYDVYVEKHAGLIAPSSSYRNNVPAGGQGL
jgi:branched-chain amino acid aminotransferase